MLARTRRVISQGALADEQASLWFEIGRARALRGERSGAMQAFEAIAAAPGGSWLGHWLAAYALDVLPREVPQIELYGPLDPDTRGGVVPFNLPRIHPHDVAQVLDRFGIAVRAGHHCTMPLHERLDLAATARASFSVYTTTDDIDRLAAGLQEVWRVFDR